MQTTENMKYEYLGYLSTILYKPDPALRDTLDSVEFSGEDLSRWRAVDVDHATEWRDVPVHKSRTEAGVRIEGDFSNVTRIDSLSENDPRYWVPLSTVDIRDDRFPIDATRYPIVEVTYRCTSQRAHPVWMWTYKGGSHFGALPKSQEWQTVARTVQHFGFPERIDNMVLRLYSPTRTVESFEVASVRFRAMSATEKEALDRSAAQLERERPKEASFPILDKFMPLGVYMDADSAKRLANMLGITATEYWDLVMQDLVSCHHNTVALAHADRLQQEEWESLLELGTQYGVKFIPRHEFPLSGTDDEQQRVIDRHVTPYKDSPAIFARMFSGEPIESDFHQVLRAKRRIELADPNHPVSLVARYPNAYPLFAPFFAASGVGHFVTKRPWDVGQMVRAHQPLGDSRQFWVAAPAFMYPTETPEWSTCPQMRLMVNLAFANGARGWLAYSYHNDPIWVRGRLQRTLTGPFLTFSDLWLELMQRMKLYSGLAPLFLEAQPVDELEDWYVNSLDIQALPDPGPGVPPISHYHLRGSDFSLYVTLSNNLREMTGVTMNLPSTGGNGLAMYHLSGYVRKRHWQPMEQRTHIEMFPGQAHIMLVAKPEVCSRWRDIITARLIENDLQKLQINLRLAKTYQLETGCLEETLANLGNSFHPDQLDTVQHTKDTLVDLIYSAPDIALARSKVIEASSAVCACDGALCRLMAQGKHEQAEVFGSRVIPLAREFTRLRLELRRGNGKYIIDQCDDLQRRSLELLDEIRRNFQGVAI